MQRDVSKEYEVGFVVMGASLDVAIKRTFPAIFRLFCSSAVKDVRVVCVCDEDVCKEDLCHLLEDNLGAGDQAAFYSRLHVVNGDFASKETALAAYDLIGGFKQVLVYYVPPLILSPGDCDEIASVFKPCCEAENGFLRCVIEKPLGRCAESSLSLAKSMDNAFGPENVFRLDHFLGKEMVQNISVLRFANRFLEPTWNNSNIQAVVVSCRETIKVAPQKYASYFDNYGIIREMLLDHLLHITALVAMETPVSLTDDSSYRDEVSKVLRCMRPASVDDIILGQYEGYLKQPGVAEGSVTPTFASCIVYIDNPRWYGVPFILKAGKGMYQRRTDVRVQFKSPHNNLYPSENGGGLQNELVIRVQPNSDIYMKMIRKVPGSDRIAATKLDLIGPESTFMMDVANGPVHTDSAAHLERIEVPTLSAYRPNSYERLLFSVLQNDSSAFTRFDELQALWAVFHPLLQKLEKNHDLAKEKLQVYPIGTRGPPEAYTRMQQVGFREYKLSSELLGAQRKTHMQVLFEAFTITAYRMETLTAAFGSAFICGLNGSPGASIKMLPSYVTRIPTGMERGVYYALDLGGTNFRTTRFVFDGAGGSKQTDERKYSIPDEVMTGGADDLFEFLAECIMSLDVQEEPGVERLYGFTFSFPMHQTALDKGILLNWTKGFTASGVIGNDVVAMLQETLEKKNFKGEIRSIANDTVGTLVSSAYNDPSTMVGVILGTGTNAAYREKVENILSLPEEIRAKGGEMVIDTEWGNFGSGRLKPLPVNEYDTLIDKDSRNPGEQIFEKMISGMYLGELTRLCLADLFKKKAIWSDSNTSVSEDLIVTKGCFVSRYLSDIEYDMSHDLVIVERVENAFGVFGSTREDRIKLKEVCGMVVQRAAKLTACGIAAVLRQVGPERAINCTVGVDGSLFEHHPSFRRRLVQSLGALGAVCNLAAAKDGSGRGSALICCTSTLPECPASPRSGGYRSPRNSF